MADQTESDKPGSFYRALRACMGTGAERRNPLIVAAACILWALAYVITNEAIAQGASLWLLLIPSIVAIGSFLAYARFLREADEYVRLLQYQGLALGFAIGIFGIATFESLRKAGHAFDVADESATVMLVSWALAQFIVIWRHR